MGTLELLTGSAEMFSTLIDPIITLADKRPMKHYHDDYKQKLSTVEFSLKTYRDIMGDKMFNKPEEYQQRIESLQSLREV